MHSAINTRMSAQLLIQSNVFRNVSNAIQSEDSSAVGYATSVDNDFGPRGTNKAAKGNLTAGSIPYAYTLLGSGHVAATVPGEAGAVLVFEGVLSHANGTGGGNSSTVPVGKGYEGAVGSLVKFVMGKD